MNIYTNTSKTKWIRWMVVSSVVAAIALGGSLLIGSVHISLREIITAFSSPDPSPISCILFQIRLPRAILAFFVGAALSIAGVLLQGVFRNPLVEPSTLGISAGAALGVVLVTVAGLHHVLGMGILPCAGFVGAVIVLLVVWSVSLSQDEYRMQRMLLNGVIISFMCSAGVLFLLSVAHTEDVHGILFWLMGSFDEADIRWVIIMAVSAWAGLFGGWLICRDLNTLSLGDEEAAHMGVPVKKIQTIVVVLASLLTSLCVCCVGMIGFVGLLIPHLVRRWVGSDYRIILVASFFLGGAFLVVCDTMARSLCASGEIPVGVITGISGGVVFLAQMRKRSFV